MRLLFGNCNLEFGNSAIEQGDAGLRQAILFYFVQDELLVAHKTARKLLSAKTLSSKVESFLTMPSFAPVAV
jgi:hypothetical protein